MTTKPVSEEIRMRAQEAFVHTAGTFSALDAALEAVAPLLRAEGAAEIRERCANEIIRLCNSQRLLLHAGEMTAQELRTVKAVFRLAETLLRDLPLAPPEETNG